MTILVNQRTSGPVIAHLTPGPGIYFNAFIHVYSPGQGQTTPLGQMLMSTESLYHFAHMLQVSKWSLRNMILYTFFMGLGQKTHWGQTFDVNRKPLSLWPFVASFKQISLNSDFIHIFNVFPHQTTLCGQSPDVNRKALSLCPFSVSFKNISLKSDFINIFACFHTSI